MTYVMVDVEADGPIPGDYSMISLGAVIVEPGLNRAFYGEIRPISDQWLPDSLAISGWTREQTLAFDAAPDVMRAFGDWLAQEAGPHPRFIADNNGFDWQFVNWYFHHFLDYNPFGYSSTNLGSLYKGIIRDMRPNFKHLRVTSHTHHPVDDVVGNAEALLALVEQYELKGVLPQP